MYIGRNRGIGSSLGIGGFQKLKRSQNSLILKSTIARRESASDIKEAEFALKIPIFTGNVET
jgi:hypothetical protein